MEQIYVTLDVIALLFEVVILIRLIISSEENNDKRFKHLVIVSILMSLIDMFWSLCFGNLLGLGVAGLNIASVLYFSACGVMSYWWFVFVLSLLKRESVSKFTHCITSIPATVVLIISLTNGITSWLFTIDDTCYSYMRGTLYPLEQILTYGYFATIMILSVVAYIRSKDGKDKRHFAIVFCVAFIPLVVGILQIYTSYLPYSCVSYALAIVIIYLFISLQEEEERRLKDIENQKQLEEAIKRADAANEAKTRFLFNMSHDIRTPMNAIIGFKDLLEKHQEEPQKRADYLRKIGDASNLLLSIINNVLEMARIESGMLEVEETLLSSEKFVESLKDIFEEMMEQKKITFLHSVEVKHNMIYCDTIKLREIYANILSNAYKYTNPGGSVILRLKELECEKPGWGIYQTTITDTGIGMSEEFLPHIFEEFAREKTTTDTKIEGTGLGMPIVKHLVEILDGTIEVKSKKGVGTTFKISIPHRFANTADMVEMKGVEYDINDFNGKRILLAEDNDLNAEITIELLSEVGFVVDRAVDGEKCVEMIKKSEAGYYNLILMDVQMPNMNGYEATKMIRKLEDEDKADIHIFAVTANAFEEDKKAAIDAGMNGHLAKPIDKKALMRTLAQSLHM